MVSQAADKPSGAKYFDEVSVPLPPHRFEQRGMRPRMGRRHQPARAGVQGLAVPTVTVQPAARDRAMPAAKCTRSARWPGGRCAARPGWPSRRPGRRRSRSRPRIVMATTCADSARRRPVVPTSRPGRA
ncbi:hypothetical protein SGPA1_40465 [Streptomyces misionensis JCM 4497]